MKPSAITGREVEPYLSRVELAALMGCHVNTIDKLVRAGMPSETFGMRRRFFKASAALQWARDRGV